MVSGAIEQPWLLLVEGEHPLLCLPAGLTAWESESAFGWAVAELLEQQEGWLALVRHTTRLYALSPVERQD